MAGFTLPKLRWLVLGALAAGAWAMTQEPPKREHWERRTARETESYEKKARVEPPAAQKPPAAKPSAIVTSAVVRPEAPVAKTFYTTDKVRLRRQASTESEVVAMLAPGAAVSVSASDGKWRKVETEGRVGWVHGDFLGRKPVATEAGPALPQTAAPIPGSDMMSPRPPADVEPQVASAPGPSIWGSLKPVRQPQISDCQCPYDLMLNGSQCGDRSAYARGRGVECFF